MTLPPLPYPRHAHHMSGQLPVFPASHPPCRLHSPYKNNFWEFALYFCIFLFFYYEKMSDTGGEGEKVTELCKTEHKLEEVEACHILGVRG
jgi:hypothetical protein